MTFATRVLRALLLENWGAKLLSLAFAVLLWMMVVGERRSEMSLNVPVELTGIPENLVIVSRVPEAVRVRLNGPRTILTTASAQPLSVVLDLKGVQPGTNTFENLGARMRLPKRIDVTYVSPSAISVEVDLKLRKTVRVKPRFRGDLAEGFRVSEVRLEPPDVLVEGAAAVLRGLEEVPAEVVDVAGVDESFDRIVEPAFPDPSLRAVNRRPLQLRVQLEEIKGNRELQHVAVAVPGGKWTAVPPRVIVRLEGGVRTLSRLSASEVRASVDEPDRPGARGQVRVEVRVPEGLRVLEVVPRSVELRQSPAAPSPEPARRTGEFDSLGE